MLNIDPVPYMAGTKRTTAWLELMHSILAVNYAALGFTFDRLKMYRHESHRLRHPDLFIVGDFTCPCGGKERFEWAIDSYLLDQRTRPLDVMEYAHHLANEILYRSASKSHLLKDVEDGTLPAFDIDKHAYRGNLISVTPSKPITSFV